MPKDNPGLTEEILLSVVVNPEAPIEIQSFALKYWELAGVDSNSGVPLWRFKTNELGFTPWSGTPSYVAAAGATATADEFVCGICGGQFTLTSRQALLDVIRGRGVECRSCNLQIDQHASKVLSGEGQEKRNAKQLRREELRAAETSQRQVETERRSTVESAYPLASVNEEFLIEDASLLARIGVLSVINGTGDQNGIIVGVDLSGESIAPTFDLSRELFVKAWSAGLLQVHPSTPNNSLAWEEGTATLTGAIYPNKVRFAAGGHGSIPDRLSNMVDAAHVRVQIDRMWSTSRTELRSLAQKIVSEEAARYLTSEVSAHQLPHLTEKNREALKLVTERGASLFSLGTLYGFAWRGARDASSVYQKNKGMSGEKAITHGLRKYETYIQAAIDNAALMKDPFGEVTNVPLSAVTRLVFNDILGLNPMTATPQDIAMTLGSPPDDELLAQCDADIPTRSDLIERIRTTGDYWTAARFRIVLARLEDWNPPLCAPHCAHERVGAVAFEAGRAFDRIVRLTDDETAAVMTAEATAIANSIREGIRTGDALLAELVRGLDIDVPVQSEF